MNASSLRIVELVVGDDPEAWRAAGFAVDEAGCAQVSTVRLRLVGGGADRGIRSWGLADADGLVIDGLATDGIRGARAEPADQVGTVHPNSSTVLDHLVIASADIDRTVAAFAALGVAARRERIGGTSAHPLRQVFLRAGEVVLEIIGSGREPGGGDQVNADHVAVDRAPRPAAFWGLAFTVADLDHCVALLGSACGAARDAVQPGRRIATLRHAELGISVPTAFMSAAP